MALSKIEFVLGDFRVEFRELFIYSCRVKKILTHIVAIGKKGHRSTSGAKLELVAEMVDSLD